MRTLVMFGEHATEEQFEAYCLGRASKAEIEEFEEHLLVCPACRQGLTEMESYIRAMRAAIAAVTTEPSPNARRWRSLVDSMRQPLPAAAMASAALVLLVWVAVPTMRSRVQGDPVPVALESMRGGDEPQRAHAAAGRPLALTLDLTGVPSLASYRVRMVDARGAAVAESDEHPTGRQLLFRTSAELRAGTYWVRLYDRAEPGTPLREYGLDLR